VSNINHTTSHTDTPSAVLPLGEAVPDHTPRPFPEATQLTGHYATLSALSMHAHADALYDCLCLHSPQALWTDLPFGPFDSQKAFYTFLNAFQNDKVVYVIEKTNQPGPLDIACFLDINPTEGVIEIGGVIFSSALQGTRAATEAIYLMLTTCFDHLKYRRCQWRCHALNQASGRAAKRFGFLYEGTFRQAQVVKGHNRDTQWYAMLDNEWPNRQAAFTRWLDPANFDAQGQQRSRLMTAIESN
jgi:RimJ/RimL family protein N-acetyltransferase